MVCSEACVITAIHRDTPQLISCHADGPVLRQLIIALDLFTSRIRNIGGEREEQVFRYALLNSHPRRRIRIISANQRIDLQAGDPGQFLYPAAHLARRLRSNHRIRALAGSRRLLGRFAAGNEVDDVGGRQRWI